MKGQNWINIAWFSFNNHFYILAFMMPSHRAVGAAKEFLHYPFQLHEKMQSVFPGFFFIKCRQKKLYIFANKQKNVAKINLPQI